MFRNEIKADHEPVVALLVVALALIGCATYFGVRELAGLQNHVSLHTQTAQKLTSPNNGR